MGKGPEAGIDRNKQQPRVHTGGRETRADMVKVSAGILLYRIRDGVLEFFLVHPGGPFFVKKDAGVWGIPKGEIGEGEDPLAAARREFEEETGFTAGGAVLPLAPVKQKGGKIVLAWAMEGDCDPETMKSNTFTMEWPPHSGRQQEFPEVDRAGWFGLSEAKQRINPAQAGFLDELERTLRSRTGA
jgi:predicted NUDIX family NTP pyrophosphohydrolase